MSNLKVEHENLVAKWLQNSFKLQVSHTPKKKKKKKSTQSIESVFLCLELTSENVTGYLSRISDFIGKSKIILKVIELI